MRTLPQSRWLVPLLLLTALSAAAGQSRYNTKASRKPGKLNVHLVPHTHDDSGWLKTFDQYYYGAKQEIQMAGVQYILDSVVQSLRDNPDRKFVYGEMSFFTRWWREQSNATQALVKQLVADGQLDFVNGGYVQHDEAAAHYVSMVDQTTRGHRFLNRTFGKTPRIGWQLDPFGHSSTQASLMSSLVGFTGLFFGRADYQDMRLRASRKELEFLWRASRSWGAASDIWTHNYPSGNYGPPVSFNFDYGQLDPPIIDDPESPDWNVPGRVSWFVAQCKTWFKSVQGNDIMFMMGSDFQFSNANVNFKNMDKLIHYANLDGQVNVFYSTLTAYVEAKQSYANTSWAVKTDDFFPYADCPHCYWTGYFTSRPTSKAYIRTASARLQAARQLAVLAKLSPAQGNTDTAEMAVSLTQHHDAITGTEKQAVANDYARLLAKGMEQANGVINAALLKLMYSEEREQKVANQLQQPLLHSRRLATIPTPPSQNIKHLYGNMDATASAASQPAASEKLVLSSSSAAAAATAAPAAAAVQDPPALQLHQCELLNVSACGATVTDAADGFMVVAYNSLAWPREQHVRVPVAAGPGAYFVQDADGNTLPSQLLPVSKSTQQAQQAMVAVGLLKSNTLGAQELLWKVTLPPLGYAAYYVRSKLSPSALEQGGLGAAASSTHHSLAEDPTLSNDQLRISFDPATGRLASIAAADGSWDLQATQSLLWYKSSVAGEEPEGKKQPSGAYIFRPSSSMPEAAEVSAEGTPVVTEVVKGPLLQEVRQTFSPWASLTTRLWEGAGKVEVEWTVGPIPSDDGGKEIVSRITTNLPTDGILYTDSNGREMIQRRRDARPAWDLEVHEPVAGNFYPMTSGASITDGCISLGIATERAQAVASLADGQLEVMVHRITPEDDSRGVAENLAENLCGCRSCRCSGLIARGTHVLTPGPSDQAAAAARREQALLNDPVVLAFAPLPAPAAAEGMGQGAAAGDGGKGSDGSATAGIGDSGDGNSGSAVGGSGSSAGGSTATGSTVAGSTARGRATMNSSPSNGDWQLPLRGRWSGLGRAHGVEGLPANVHLLTLMPTDEEGRAIIRLAHMFQVEEDAQLSAPATVNLSRLLGRPIASFAELSLSAAQYKSQLPARFPWKAGGPIGGGAGWQGQAPAKETYDVWSHGREEGSVVELGPMEIRTWEVVFA